MRIIPAPPNVARVDPLVVGSSLPVRVKLSPNVLHVKAGTPLTQDALGWRVAREGEPVVLFSTTYGRGGDLVSVAREVVLQLPAKVVPCARYKIADTDETGYPDIRPDGDGPHLALTDESVLLTPDL